MFELISEVDIEPKITSEALRAVDDPLRDPIPSLTPTTSQTLEKSTSQPDSNLKSYTDALKKQWKMS